MNRLLDHDTEPYDERRIPGTAADREISLGTGTILGMFFGLTLVCAVFFAFGYGMGRKSGQSAAATPAASTAPVPASYAPKPMAGSPAGRVGGSTAVPAAQPVSAAATGAPAPRAGGNSGAVAPSDTMLAGERPAAAAGVQSGSPGAGSFMVQIAAVSSQEIADIELTALKKFGYDVVVRHEPQDALLHIQIGPFATRKDAEGMRANVQSHGFNAIIK